MSRYLSIFAGLQSLGTREVRDLACGNVVWALCSLVLTAVGEIHPAQQGRPVTEAVGIALVLRVLVQCGLACRVTFGGGTDNCSFVKPLVLQWGAY